ncbi:MAG: hypothetical protein IAF38_07030 [Bacteroidia bacterium]|nr:hypothetical protein [Bacteroidia bacterium]
MKKLITLIALLTLSLSVNAQNKKFIAGMKKSIACMDSVKKTEQFQSCANDFERIANAEKKEWLPNYYAGYCYVLLAFNAPTDKIDALCDKADQFLKKADSLNPNNSEIYVVRAMVASARISVNPMARGMQYGMESGTLLEKAIGFDPKNPRAYLQKGTSTFYTPEMYGGGAKLAKPSFEKAIELYKTFKPASEVHPNWGKAMTDDFLKKCE